MSGSIFLLSCNASLKEWFDISWQTAARLGGEAARTLWMCAPPGLEAFFVAVGDPVDSRTAPAPKLRIEEQGELMKRAEALAPKYRTEILKP